MSSYDRFPEEVLFLKDAARQVAERGLGPLVRDVDEKGEFSHEVVAVLREAGWLGMGVSAAWGGVDSDVSAFVVVMEEVSKVFPTAASILAPHWFASKMVSRFAEGPWVAPLLDRVVNGQVLGALAATEPDAGSDLASVSTTAQRDGGEWVINGSKRFITNGGFADFYVVLTRTDGNREGGLSMFLVEADRPGIKIGRLEKKMGLRASATAEIFFDDLRVEADHLIGEQGSGFKQASKALVEGRVMVASISLGIAQGCLEHAIAYARERKQFGRPIGEFQGIQFMLANMAIETAAARSLTCDAAVAVQSDAPDAGMRAAIAKTFASDAAMSVSTNAVQVLGGVGYTSDFPVEMLMRDAKIQQIYEGTNEIQRTIIAKRLLGRPSGKAS
jgi:hypothetical protein